MHCPASLLTAPCSRQDDVCSYLRETSQSRHCAMLLGTSALYTVSLLRLRSIPRCLPGCVKPFVDTGPRLHRILAPLPLLTAGSCYSSFFAGLECLEMPTQGSRGVNFGTQCLAQHSLCLCSTGTTRSRHHQDYQRQRIVGDIFTLIAPLSCCCDTDTPAILVMMNAGDLGDSRTVTTCLAIMSRTRQCFP
jgi:hypothetical protein